MARTRVRFAALVVLLAAGLTVTAAGRAGAGSPVSDAPAAAVEHVVQPGDTLWSIARNLVGPEGDPRPLIDEIRAANDLDVVVLREGQRLRIP